MTNTYEVNALGRWTRHQVHRLSDALLPVATPWIAKRPKMWWIPRPPIQLAPRAKSPARPWTVPIPQPAAALLTHAGIQLDRDKQDAALRSTPLHEFFVLHPGMRSAASPTSHMWMATLSTAPRLWAAARRRAAFVRTAKPERAPSKAGPEELTAAMRREAARLGLSAVGVTAYDIRYNFVEYHGLNVGDTIIVGILEQHYDSTQISPSVTAERAALTAYAQLEDRMRELAEWIVQQGYSARPEGFVGESLAIAYGVAAGLGQLGLNGQLLTPQAGSRCRLHVMSTNAPFVHDVPVDYGIEGVCNECQICVRRCPAGAIPAVRKEHRGVYKAKLNTKRCLPVMGKAAGCSVCMKVCPVQRFGLPAVLEEFESTGRILGKDSDDLEGFDWPVDGRHYGLGERPRIVELLNTPGFDFDAGPRTIASATRESAHDGFDEAAETAVDQELGPLGY